jgi:hypothetical protein
MLKSMSGDRLFRKVIVKVIFPEAIFPTKTFVNHAGPSQGFNPDGIDAILMGIADQLDTLYPFWEFKVVPLVPEGRTMKYVFTFAGYRSTKINPNEESSTLEPGAAAEPPTEVGNALAVPSSQE